MAATPDRERYRRRRLSRHARSSVLESTVDVARRKRLQLCDCVIPVLYAAGVVTIAPSHGGKSMVTQQHGAALCALGPRWVCGQSTHEMQGYCTTTHFPAEEQAHMVATFDAGLY